MPLKHDKRGRLLPGGHWRERKPFWNKEWLEREYLEKGRSMGDIAAEFGVLDTAVQYWAKKHGIPTRSVSQARALKHWGVSGSKNPLFGRSGTKHYNWKGGLTPERQREYAKADVRAFLTSIRSREGGRCKRCGKQARLDVHHIRSWSDYPTLRYDADNCVALCRPCHRWVHSSQNADGEYLKP